MDTQAAVKAAVVKDKFENLMWDAQFALVLLATEDGSDWELVEAPVNPDKAVEYRARGLGFGGVFALQGGKPATALALALEPETVSTIAAEFVARWKRSFTHPVWAVKVAPGVN